ncbi:MASE1 domain-containing protein [Chitinasiproducens palmae]|uniref:Integral membrane sensor domain MASE1 n=1 Tax=Chitinasiproducens palmae TaxID=1770053 RepID=A0A1H2PXS8_9BURK|nr:MASE1 domain-containing protein [Chitinasiproducens palmae]SDV51456.1 Integral membrane sensor domain MASE1 [Chitinasiproducens palmae]
MRSPSLPRLILFLLGYGLLAFAAIHIRDEVRLAALIWPAAGILLGTLMVAPYRNWPVWMLIAGTIHVVAGVVSGRTLGTAALFAVIDLAYVFGIARGWRWKCGARCDLTQPASLFWFLGTVIVGSLAGGAILILALRFNGEQLRYTDWTTWAMSDGVGCLLGAPLVIAWSNFRVQRSGGINGRQFALGLLWFAALLVSGVAVFNPGAAALLFGGVQYSLTYLPLFFVVLLALVWDQRGTTLGLIMLAALSSVHTVQGDGPFAFPGETLADSLTDLQAYLGAATVFGLVAVALNTSRQRALREAAAWRLRYEGALLASQQVAFEFDPATGRIAWGGPITEVLGVPPASIATVPDFVARVHEDDRAPLHAAFQKRRRGEVSDTGLRLRFRGDDGRERDLVETGAPIVDFDGEVYRIEGMLRRETPQVAVAREPA